MDQSVDFRLTIAPDEWEAVRLTMVREPQGRAEFIVPAFLLDGRSAEQVAFPVSFQLEKFLPGA